MIRGLAALVLAAAGLLSACATVPRTPAEELAWARWRQCDRFPAVELDRIWPDGAIATTVKTGAISGLTDAAAWKRCMDDAAAAQGARPAGSGVPPGTQ